MDVQRTTASSLLLLSLTLLRGTYSRLDMLWSIGARVPNSLIGMIPVTTGVVLVSFLKLVRLLFSCMGAVAIMAASLQIIRGSSDILGLLSYREDGVSGNGTTGTVGPPSTVDSTSEFSELLGWMLPVSIVAAITSISILVTWAGPGGSAWSASRLRAGQKLRIAPGPAGMPLVGCAKEMRGNAHRKLARLALEHNAQKLMAFSVGCTRIVITSDPAVARDMLVGAAFAERPLKEAAEKLLFARAMGFAAPGPYWRGLRKIAATSLFCPKQIIAHKQVRQEETTCMLKAIHEAATAGVFAAATDVDQWKPVRIRSFLQRASVNNMMRVVFGRRYDFGECVTEAENLEEMIRCCFDVLGAFNWADHFPGLRLLDMLHVGTKCKTLVPKVKAFVQLIIDEHRSHASVQLDSHVDFVDVLLALEGEDKLSDEDMISVLWEMIFRGTDTIAVLTEWALAELTIHPEWQRKLQEELDKVVGPNRTVEDSDMASLPFLQAVLKETLRVHPPGPLLSWARLATEDVKLGGYDVPRGTTAMVNMWSITHDPTIWPNPFEFSPDRFLSKDASNFDVRGGDLRLAPFGAGRRVCPGRSLGLATSHLWLARLLHHFSWSEAPEHPVDLTEELKLSCEMAFPLHAVASLRIPLVT